MAKAAAAAAPKAAKPVTLKHLAAEIADKRGVSKKEIEEVLAETIALIKGDADEKKRLAATFEKTVSSWRDVIIITPGNDLVRTMTLTAPGLKPRLRPADVSLVFR